MHPNQAFRTFVFTLNPVTELASLRTAFADEDAALALIQRECRERLLGLRFEGKTNDDTVLSLDADWVEDGTKEWDHFNNFAFSQEGIDILRRGRQAPQVQIRSPQQSNGVCLRGIR